MKLQSPAMPGRKDGQPNKPGQGAPKKPKEAKRERRVLYMTDADYERLEAWAKESGIDLRKRKASSPLPSTEDPND